MIKKIYLILMGALLVSNLAYAELPTKIAKETVKLDSKTIYGKKWVLTEFMGKAIEEYKLKGDVPYISFDEKENRVFGFGGVNRFSGNVAVTEFSLKFGPMISTLMAGENMEFESDFMETLGKINVYYVNEDTLSMTVNKMGFLMKFKEEKPMVEDMHNSENSIDWDGTYKGVTPSASGEGIETTITLNKDLSFVEKTKYLGKSKEVFETKGSFIWDKSGKKIILFEKGEEYKKLMVGEDKVILLDLEGNVIDGNLADKYILKKSKSSFEISGEIKYEVKVF